VQSRVPVTPLLILRGCASTPICGGTVIHFVRVAQLLPVTDLIKVELDEHRTSIQYRQGYRPNGLRMFSRSLPQSCGFSKPAPILLDPAAARRRPPTKGPHKGRASPVTPRDTNLQSADMVQLR